MNEDGEQSQPAGTSRGALAASTLRALRASRGSAPAADEQAPAASAEAPVEDETAATDTVSLAKPEPAEDEPTIVVLTGQPGQPEQIEQPTDELATDEPAAPGVPRRGRALTAACAVLAAAALVFAVVAGVIWWTAGHSGQHKLGVARVQVRKDAKLAIVTVNTSDYRHPSAALSNWLDVSTGSLHSQFSSSRTAAIKLLAEAKTVTKATVLDDAVTSIDLSKGTASVLASVNVTRDKSGKTSTVRNRFRATLQREGGQWKLSNLSVVSVSLS